MAQLKALYDYDALPYADTEYDHPLVQQAVTSLIEAEMATFRPNADDYLKDYPYPVLSERFQTLIGQHEQHEQSGGGIDLSRYTLKDPATMPTPAKRKAGAAKEAYPFNDSCGELHEAVARAKALVEYQDNRLQHLELQIQHIAPLWLKHIETIESATVTLESKLAEIDKQSNIVNYERRNEQLAWGKQLGILTRKRDAVQESLRALQEAIIEKRARLN
jgi:hypothetical protein